LPLASLGTLFPAVPILLEHLWSERRHQHTIVFHYATLIVPFVIAASVQGLARVAARLGVGNGKNVSRGVALGLAVVAVAIATNVMFGPVGGRQILQRAPRNESIWPPEYDRTLTPFREQMLKRVPRDGGVVAGFEFLPRLARRAEVHSIHHVLSG